MGVHWIILYEQAHVPALGNHRGFPLQSFQFRNPKFPLGNGYLVGNAVTQQNSSSKLNVGKAEKSLQLVAASGHWNAKV